MVELINYPNCPRKMPNLDFVTGVLIIWLTIISLVLFWQIVFFWRLTKGAKGENLQKVLEKIFQAGEINTKNVSQLDRDLKRLTEDVSYHVQKIGLVKFNPFRDLGGDHSFSLALLDGRGTGLILTTLHTRDRTRMYLKGIKNGKSEHELSQEEKKALMQALRKN